MAIKRYKPEQIMNLLRQIGVGIANGRPASLQKSEDHGTDLLPLAERIWLFEAGSSQTPEGTGKGKR